MIGRHCLEYPCATMDPKSRKSSEYIEDLVLHHQWHQKVSWTHTCVFTSVNYQSDVCCKHIVLYCLGETFPVRSLQGKPAATESHYPFWIIYFLKLVESLHNMPGQSFPLPWVQYQVLAWSRQSHVMPWLCRVSFFRRLCLSSCPDMPCVVD